MDPSIHCYTGNILFVNLTTRTVTVRPLSQEWAEAFWGGWGLALRYYWEAVTPEVDPLAPENALVLMTGTLGGTLAPMSGRFCLVSKSPQTGTVFESNVGGAFSNELKFAGYDGMVITGKADSPVALTIADDGVHLVDAQPIWGLGTFEADRRLKAMMGTEEAKTLSIGPAGENLVPYACVSSEAYRQLGRGGSGALFGSKRLKGIACRGTGAVRVADMTAFLQQARTALETSVLSNDNRWAETDGTPILMDATNEMGIHPTRNFSRGVNDAIAPLASDAIKAHKRGDRACAACPLACGKFTEVNGARMEGPEYETLCMGGSNCGVNDLEQVIHFNRRCDDLGLDTISCGNTMAMAMEMTQQGRHDFRLNFGSSPDYLEVIEEIASLSTPRGRDLALGAKGLAEKYDCRDLSLEIKGMELPAYDPRGNYGMGLTYAVSERGACHMRAFTVFSDAPFDLEAQARDVVDAQNLNTIKWSLGLCDVWGTVTPELMADLLSAGLGRTVTPEALLLAGERIWNLSRMFNLRAGWTADDDRLPVKILSTPLPEGPQAGRIFAETDFMAAREMFYAMRGWDVNGVPGPEKLTQLDLSAF